MKKNVLWFCLVWMGPVLHAQDQRMTDSLICADLGEAAAGMAKGDLYTASARYQQVLTRAKAANLPGYMLEGYKGLVRVSEKSYNYVKALEYERICSHLQDSLQQIRFTAGQAKRDSAFQKQLTDFREEQARDKAQITGLIRQQNDFAGENRELHLYLYLAAGLSAVLVVVLVILSLYFYKRRKSSTPDPNRLQEKMVEFNPHRQQNTLLQEPPSVGKAVPEQKEKPLPASEPLPVQIPDTQPDSGLQEFFPESFVLGGQDSVFVKAGKTNGGALVLFLGRDDSHPNGAQKQWISAWQNLISSDKSLPADTALAGFLPAGAGVPVAAMLCVFDLKGGWLRFAAAHVPLWLIRKGELREFTASSAAPSAVQTLGLRKGDCLYLVLLKPESVQDTALLKEKLLALHLLPVREQSDQIRASLATTLNFGLAGIRI